MADTLTATSAGISPADVMSVTIGGSTFAPDDNWGAYIADQLTKAIDASAVGVQRAANEHLNKVVRYVEQVHGKLPWNGQLVNDTDRLQRRSGGLMERFKQSAKVTPAPTIDGISAQVNVGVFGIHLDGGVIRAKRSRYLTIPLPAACDGRGVPLKSSSRAWQGTFVIRSKRGNLLICIKGPNGKPKPLYLLKTSVRIPGRLKGIPNVWDLYATQYEASVMAAIAATIDKIQW